MNFRPVYPLETDLRSAVEDYLSRRRDLVWSRTDAGGKDPKTRGRNVRAGWSDLTIVVRGGRAVLVELKRPKGGRMRPAQKKLRADVLRLGGVAVVARSVADVHAAVEGAME
jgi:hypothetical protein